MPKNTLLSIKSNWKIYRKAIKALLEVFFLLGLHEILIAADSEAPVFSLLALSSSSLSISCRPLSRL